MSLALKTIPDDPTLLPQWLDKQLVGDQLHNVIAELSGMQNGPTSRLPIEGVLGAVRDAFLNRGSVMLSPIQIQNFLQHPKSLFDLQTLVFTEGGDYWFNVPRPGSMDTVTETSWEQLETRLSNPKAPVQNIVQPAPAKVPPSVAKKSLPSWLVASGTAAVVLVGVFVYSMLNKGGGKNEVAAVNWGWAKPGAIPETCNPKDCYETFAKSAEEWYQEKPTTAPALAKRINEFRQGCSMLITSELTHLNEAQRKELKDRCRKWAGKLDEALTKLEAGESVETVRASVDGTVDTLVKFLRAEAGKA